MSKKDLKKVQNLLSHKQNLIKCFQHKRFFICSIINHYKYNKMNEQPLLKQQAIPARLLSKDKKTNAMITSQFYKNKIKQERTKINALIHNFKPGYIQAEEGQQTLKVTQKQIQDIVNVQTAANMFDLNLNMGDYVCEYSLNGSSLLLGSSQGHTSIINWRQKTPTLEINLKQNITHGKFLHNDDMFSIVQTSGTYIYDNRGIELHKLDQSLGLQYLPYHFLLATYDQRKLRYYDTTTGHVIADHIARNPYTVMRQNRSNAIIALGSAKGTVQWWTPGIGNPAIKLFVGAGISDIGFYKGYMYTAAQNLKVWDSRMLKVLQTYPISRKVTSIQLSQSGLLSINYGFRMDIFKEAHVVKQTHPYMTYRAKGTINNMRFVPFQDLMGLGTNYGFSSISVPGSGIPYYDTFQNNPFQTKKQKRQSLVHKLLDKLPPQTITVDPNILGNVDKTERAILEKQQKQQIDEAQHKKQAKKLNKKKMRGKNSIKSKLSRKNIQQQKQKRQELTKIINTKLWAKWAEKKKKEKQMQLLNQISQKGLSIAQLTVKSKKIKKDQLI